MEQLPSLIPLLPATPVDSILPAFLLIYSTERGGCLHCVAGSDRMFSGEEEVCGHTHKVVSFHATPIPMFYTCPVAMHCTWLWSSLFPAHHVPTGGPICKLVPSCDGHIPKVAVGSSTQP